jgi:hypothetical protein
MARPGPKKGSRKSAQHKKKLAKAVEGKKNGRFVNGRRSYRGIAGAKSGEVVHHKDGDRNNNSPSNLVKLKGKKSGTNTTSRHEKITKRGQGRKKGGKNKTRSLSTSVNVRTYKLFGTKKGKKK